MADNPETILSVGGLAALVTLVISGITKYLLDRKRQDGDQESELVKRLQERIDELERQNAECMKRDAEQSKRIGYLEAKVEALQAELDRLKK